MDPSLYPGVSNQRLPLLFEALAEWQQRTLQRRRVMMLDACALADPASAAPRPRASIASLPRSHDA
jgi:hypothetical protein